MGEHTAYKANEDKRELLVLDQNGVYIPQRWVTTYYRHNQWTPFKRVGWIGLSKWARMAIEAGPDYEHYWDAWDEACRTVKYITETGRLWTLEPDGDLWAIRNDYEYPED